MGNRARQIALAQAAAGMVLSDSLLDRHGNVLLPEGAVLTDTMLASLARHGIEMLPILCEEVSEADQAAERECKLQRLSRLFRNHPGDEATERMLNHLTQYRLGAES
jgi:hypothetical protein